MYESRKVNLGSHPQPVAMLKPLARIKEIWPKGIIKSNLVKQPELFATFLD
jgi:hypothetical protein